jgi:predicted nucleic acid-binding protein
VVFIDTNIFVYAHDETDPKKAKQARQLLVDLATDGNGCISTQVIQEFCNVALRKSVTPLLPKDIGRIIKELLAPLLAHRPDGLFYLRTLVTYSRYSLSFYDAAIVQAAIDLNCAVLYSEDMQTGARYGKVLVTNPFV